MARIRAGTRRTTRPTALAAGRHDQCRFLLEIHAELLLEEFAGFRKGVAEVLRILLPPHPEVREVMEEEAEDLLAVTRIGARVEDVLVPEGIDRLCGDDRLLRETDVQLEELLVQHLSHIDFRFRPAHAFFRIHELSLDHGEVELVDRDKRAVDLPLPDT